jgi:hypothetical protein
MAPAHHQHSGRRAARRRRGGDHNHGLGYISNAARADMLKAMLEFIEKNLAEGGG